MSDAGQEGMLFKRSINVPEGVAVEMLLQKWNPGLPDYAIEDMLVSVLRWNGLQSFDDLAGVQEIVIPTIVPPGLTPRQWRESQKDYPRRKPFSIAGASFEQPAAPPPPARNLPVSPMTAAPSRPPDRRPAFAGGPASGGSGGGTGAFTVPTGPGAASKPPARVTIPIAHRSAPGASLLEHKLRQTAGSGPWQASNKQGETLAGSDVKEQFQKQMAQQMWLKRTMARPF
jgi:hypothetical protein